MSLRSPDSGKEKVEKAENGRNPRVRRSTRLVLWCELFPDRRRRHVPPMRRLAQAASLRTVLRIDLRRNNRKDRFFAVSADRASPIQQLLLTELPQTTPPAPNTSGHGKMEKAGKESVYRQVH